MKRTLLIVAAIAVVMVWLGCAEKPDGRTVLFNGEDFSGWTLFLPGDSVDVNDVWSVKDGVVHCVGKPNGFMRTEASYSNYALHLEWRWVETASNSGVLLHIQGEDKVWPNCIEAQLKSGNAGDIVLIDPGQITVDDSVYVNEDRFLIIPHREDGVEKPIGEWNSYDIICKANTITFYVNDVLQNQGINTSISEGPIGLQSEGAPIEFRNIYLEAL